MPDRNEQLLQGVIGMDLFSNLWKSPKTSISGLLIAVATVAGTLSQQGITLGTAGTGTVVTLIGALATALLGLLAQDPNSNSSTKNTPGRGSGSATLGMWALIVLLIPLPWIEGCSATTVAQEIVNWTPSLQSAVATVDSTAALLVPEAAEIFTTATEGFDAATNLLVTQAKAYLADPSASLLTKLQVQVVTMQQQVNTALLEAAKIVNQTSQAHALTVINAVATIISAILSLVQSISGKAIVAGMASMATTKLAQVRPLLNEEQAARIVAAHYGEPVTLARMQIAQVERNAYRAGF
jgi:hypothetical protein